MRRRDIPAALIASTTGTAIPPRISQSSPVSDVRQFGVVGDGKTDDTAAMFAALATGQSLDIGNLLIRITRRLTVEASDQCVYGHGGTLVYDGPATDRLLDIDAVGVHFQHVRFDGHGRQVKACLVYVKSNAERCKFTGCQFTNIKGTHVGGSTSNDSNCQYAVMISPYGVAGFAFSDCSFDEIYNDNSGANGTRSAPGLGFAGGIFIYPDDFQPPTARQAMATSGRIHGCLFRDIKTVLSNGLSLADSIDLQDAEGIRFLGTEAGATALHVNVSDCLFYDCSKRAIKGSVARGVKVENITVIATPALQYPMVTAVKVDGDDFQLRGMNVYSPPDAPIRIVIQTHDGRNLCVEDIFADRCTHFWSIAPTAKSVVLSGWRVSNLRCAAIVPGVDGPGLGITVDTLPHHFEDCVFEKIDLECDRGSHSLLAGCFVADSSRLEIVLQNWRIVNGDLKILGAGYELQSIYHELNDADYVSSAPNRGLLEAGQDAGAPTLRDSVMRGYTLNIKSIGADYLSAGRQYFAAVIGDRTQVAQFRIWVPESQDTQFSHVRFDGSDYIIDGIEYGGAGCVDINNFSAGTKLRMTVNDARRLGGTRSSVSFLNLYLSQDCTVTDIADYRMTSVASITIHSGSVSSGRTSAYILDGVRSLSSAANVVTDARGLAKQLNIQKF